jgi:hypothetical protein
MTKKQVEDVMVTDIGEVTPEHASSNFFWTYGEENFNVQTTVRGTLSDAQIDAHISSAAYAMRRIVELGGQAKQVGKQPEGNGNGSQASPLPEALPTENVSHPTPDLFFDAVELVGESSGGKESWKVKGGKFTQYGVRIWPEILDAAGIPSENLDVSRTYKLDGYTAYYVENDKGNPQKVVNLAKA